MEGLAPPLKCLIEMQSALQNGEVIRQGLRRYLQATVPGDEFATVIRRFTFAWDQGQDWRELIGQVTSPHRRALLDLIATGFAGQPVMVHLEELRTEIIAACDLEIRGRLDMLPLKMLVPLLFFQFPAFLLLLFGPLLSRLVQELNR